jgi:hypothetical protein
MKLIYRPFSQIGETKIKCPVNFAVEFMRLTLCRFVYATLRNIVSQSETFNMLNVSLWLTMFLILKN